MGDPLNDSYYAATANAFEAKPATDAAYDVDVVVVGGGFTGLSAALSCAEKGYRVTLVEAETIGYGASGRNGGQLIPGLRWSMTEIDASFGRERAKAIFDLAWSARDRVWDRIAQLGIDCDLKPGHFEAAYKSKHFDDMQREAAFLSSQFGYETEVVAPAHLSDHINGGGYHGGIYDRQGGHFHPLNYALGLAKAAQDAGVTIIENARVNWIKDSGDVEVFFGSSTVNAKFAIIATDSWIGDIAPDLGRYTVPIMNYNIATAPIPDADALLPSDAAVADSRFVLNYFRLSADKRMIFGGGEKYTTRVPADIAGFVGKHMVDVFPSLAQTPIDYAWGGAVAVTMNRLPHFGRQGNCFYAHGFSGHGALMTTLAGELIAEALRGTAERFDVFANLPHRAFPGGKWLRQPLATAGLLWYALRDRL
jgi:gamma-glutamylputrescine oxidase